ncbi:MAG: hypothetical protein KGZ63_00330 [Clostridiales bacterium]|jgi:hypothetical protein|nr:hypothetical protein [Clostridiales bacterium]
MKTLISLQTVYLSWWGRSGVCILAGLREVVEKGGGCFRVVAKHQGLMWSGVFAYEEVQEEPGS